MRQKSMSLGILWDNSVYYEKLLLKNLRNNELKKTDLIRYYFSNYQFFRAKFERENNEFKRVSYEKQFKNFWNLYSQLVSVNSATEKDKNPDFYLFQ